MKWSVVYGLTAFLLVLALGAAIWLSHKTQTVEDKGDTIRVYYRDNKTGRIIDDEVPVR
jgi:hypothetical protein